MAKENPGRGYDRIVGAMANLGHRLSDQTVGNILRRHGLSPAPMRKQVKAMGTTSFLTISPATNGFALSARRFRPHPIYRLREAPHFLTVRDQEKSKDFYVRILGGKVIKQENPCYIKLANSWIILNSGGGPTPDKPQVLLETPSDLNRVNGFPDLRVADIWACYKQWRDKGAFFLTEPLDNHGWEWRCYMRDPDGYLIEIGQYSQMALDRFKNDAS